MARNGRKGGFAAFSDILAFLAFWHVDAFPECLQIIRRHFTVFLAEPERFCQKCREWPKLLFGGVFCTFGAENVENDTFDVFLLILQKVLGEMERFWDPLVRMSEKTETRKSAIFGIFCSFWEIHMRIYLGFWTCFFWVWENSEKCENAEITKINSQKAHSFTGPPTGSEESVKSVQNHRKCRILVSFMTFFGTLWETVPDPPELMLISHTFWVIYQNGQKSTKISDFSYFWRILLIFSESVLVLLGVRDGLSGFFRKHRKHHFDVSVHQWYKLGMMSRC